MDPKSLRKQAKELNRLAHLIEVSQMSSDDHFKKMLRKEKDKAKRLQKRAILKLFDV